MKQKTEVLTDSLLTDRVSVLKSLGKSYRAKTQANNKTISKDLEITLDELKVIIKTDPMLKSMIAANNRNTNKALRREKEFIAINIESFIEAEERSDWSRDEFMERMQAECKRLSKAFWDIYNNL